MPTLQQELSKLNQPAIASGFQHIGDILPVVLASIVESAQLQHNPERTEQRSYPLRWAA